MIPTAMRAARESGIALCMKCLLVRKSSNAIYDAKTTPPPPSGDYLIDNSPLNTTMPLRDADNFERSHSHNDDTGGSHMSTIAAAEGRGMLFKTINVDGLNIFYREAGSEAAPQFVLLHEIGRAHV